MKKRRPLRSKSSKRQFTRTAMMTNKRNLVMAPMRGGIRA